VHIGVLKQISPSATVGLGWCDGLLDDNNVSARIRMSTCSRIHVIDSNLSLGLAWLLEPHIPSCYSLHQYGMLYPVLVDLPSVLAEVIFSSQSSCSTPVISRLLAVMDNCSIRSTTSQRSTLVQLFKKQRASILGSDTYHHMIEA